MRASGVVLLVAALIVTNGLWAYLYVDSASALDQRSDEVKRQKAISEQLAVLLIGLPRDRGVKATQEYMSRTYPGSM
jgi:hypothetical protein